MNIDKFSKTKLFIFFATIGLFIVLILDIMDSHFSFHELLVEFHGLVFDLFIFGILLTIYESITSRKEKIQRYKEELSDYKFWESEEAFYRNRGLVKRLVNLNENELNLSHCYFATDSSFTDYKDMRKWNFANAKLMDCFFLMSNMENANFYIANIKGATFTEVNLTNCKFGSTILVDTNFERCNLTNIKLDDAYVGISNWFEMLEYKKNIGVKELREKYRISEEPIVIREMKVYQLKLK